MQTPFSQALGIDVPLICGAMYPCSNPELVAAVSEAGGIGIVQPVAMVYVHGHDFRGGLRYLKSLTSKPFGVNFIMEKTAKVYEDRMRRWADIALEEGVRFFVTALGNPKWLVERAHANNALVYHDVTERRFATKALESNVDGFICVNNRAGGHAGRKTPEELLREMGDLGRPLICAGGIGCPADFRRILELGYAGAQLGTRFIATTECRVHNDYKAAIVKATADDIVLTERITGVPCAVIRTPYVDRIGTKAGPIARRLLKGRRTKYFMRSVYMLRSAFQLKRASLRGVSYMEFFQAGKSVDGVESVLPAGDIVRAFRAALTQPLASAS